MNLLLCSSGLGALAEFVPAPAKIGFIFAASELYIDPYFVRADRAHMQKQGYTVEDIDISHEPREKIIAQMDSIDALFVAGGNTFYLLQQIRRQDLADDLCRLVLKGLPYIGSSAGAVIAGPSIAYIDALDDAGWAPSLPHTDGLNLTSFAVLPHAREKNKMQYDEIVAGYGRFFEVVPLTDHEALVTRDGKTYQILPSVAE